MAPVTPEALESAEMEAGIELHEEFDVYGEYYDDPIIMARARGIIFAMHGTEREQNTPRVPESVSSTDMMLSVMI